MYKALGSIPSIGGGERKRGTTAMQGDNGKLGEDEGYMGTHNSVNLKLHKEVEQQPLRRTHLLPGTLAHISTAAILMTARKQNQLR